MKRNVALEAINYQVNDPFKHDLEALFVKIFDDVDNQKFKDNKKLIESGHGQAMANLIRSRFNLNIVPSSLLSAISPAAIIPFSSDMMNQFDEGKGTIPDANAPVRSQEEIDAIYRAVDRVLEERKVTAKKINNQKGSINFKRAIVSGYLSEVRHHLLIDAYVLRNEFNLTPMEAAAVITHEIGHAFTGLESHFRLVTTNQAIQKVLNHVNNGELDKATYVYRSEFGAEELQEFKLDKGADRNDFYGAVAKKYVRIMESQYANSKYDFTSFEYMSDSFASNMGFGGELVTALRKMYDKHAYMVTTFRWWSEVQFTGHILLTIGMMLGGPGGIIMGFFYATLGTFFSYLMAKQPAIYDNFKDRNERIGKEVIHALKNQTMPVEEAKMLVAQYEMIQTINGKTVNYRSTLSKLWHTILPSFREADRAREEQQNAEDLMNSPLFVKVAKLKLLGEK